MIRDAGSGQAQVVLSVAVTVITGDLSCCSVTILEVLSLIVFSCNGKLNTRSMFIEFFMLVVG